MKTPLAKIEMKTEMNKQTRNRYNIMRKLIGDASNKIILDIGAGDTPISKRINSKKTIRLDGDKRYNPDIIYDINKGLSLENNSIDIIIAGEIIEHLLDPVKFLKECNRVMTREGKIILSTPNICSLKNRLRVLFGMIPEHSARYSDYHSMQRHVVDFNLNELKKLFKKTGFTILKIKTNGITFKKKVIFPLEITPSTFGECLIILGVKNGK